MMTQLLLFHAQVVSMQNEKKNNTTGVESEIDG